MSPLPIRTLVLCLVWLVASQCYGQDSDVYDVGVGIADVTGPCGDVELWGYATFKQPAGGIHTRTFSRAFIVGQGDKRVVLVTVDIGSISEILKMKLVDKLRSRYGNLYGTENVVLSATHTHSAPGGFHQYLLYAIPAQGFIQQTFDAALDGIFQSIVKAHDSIRKGRMYWNQGDLTATNYNRSPASYMNNPTEEKARYKYDVDKRMSLIKFTDLEGKDLGMINWFAVHPTSMDNTNNLVSGDNKGYAAGAFEAFMNVGSLPGQGSFVAAFSQKAHGDTSPNVKGPRCIDTGLPCHFETSSCNGKSDKCRAQGPGTDMFDSTKIIGDRQFTKAKELYSNSAEKISGSVDYRHQFLDISNYSFKLKSGETVHTCPSALGYSFAAGTTDGPGMAIFTQGSNSTSTIWNMVRNIVKKPTKELQNCQAPKPILLATGQMTFPYQWQPQILPTQVIKIGNVYLAPVPAEFSTMSGRRLEQAILDVVEANEVGGNTHVVVQSLSNAYSSYVTTFEEYQMQRYESASTLYGPHTLSAYLSQYKMLAESIKSSTPVSPGPQPPDMLSKQITLRPGVIFDSVGIGKKYGDVIQDAGSVYRKGEEVSVKFRSGHPRNALKLVVTYMTVERLESSGSWKVIATDANWETRFYWKRTVSILGRSEVTTTWKIPQDAPAGQYRIRHFGHSKNLFQKVTPYTGTSRTFLVQ